MFSSGESIRPGEVNLSNHLVMTQFLTFSVIGIERSYMRTWIWASMSVIDFSGTGHIGIVTLSARYIRVCQKIKIIFDQIINIRVVKQKNFKTFSIFMFSNFIYLPFFPKPFLAANLYIAVLLVLY